MVGFTFHLIHSSPKSFMPWIPQRSRQNNPGEVKRIHDFSGPPTPLSFPQGFLITSHSYIISVATEMGVSGHEVTCTSTQSMISISNSDQLLAISAEPCVQTNNSTSPSNHPILHGFHKYMYLPRVSALNFPFPVVSLLYSSIYNTSPVDVLTYHWLHAHWMSLDGVDRDTKIPMARRSKKDCCYTSTQL